MMFCSCFKRHLVAFEDVIAFIYVSLTLKGPNGGPCIVTDDNVKGPLVLNSVIEAKNPDTNLYQEAVISKLTDCR